MFNTKHIQPARKYFSMAGSVLLLGYAYYSFDVLMNRFEIEANIEKRLKTPALIGGEEHLFIRIAPHPDIPENWIDASTGFLGATRADDLVRWQSLEPGCRFRLSIHRHNPRGKARYILKSADKISCPADQASSS
jgi:hypothetical protein